MGGLSPEHLSNWLSLYVATGICAAIATAAAAVSVGIEVVRERQWQGVRGIRATFLFVPKLWLRWQLRYLTATPVILAVVGYYATSLRW